MDTGTDRIEHALGELRQLDAELARGDVELVRRSGAEVVELDPRVDAMKELWRWWNHYETVDNEALESLAWLTKECRGGARQLFTTVSDGVVDCRRLEPDAREVWQIRILLDLIATRGALQFKRDQNGQANTILVFAAVVVAILGWMVAKAGALLQSLPYVAPVLVVLVLLKLGLLTRPIRRLRGRIAELEAALEELDARDE
jgi:hypothetical protein